MKLRSFFNSLFIFTWDCMVPWLCYLFSQTTLFSYENHGVYDTTSILRRLNCLKTLINFVKLSSFISTWIKIFYFKNLTYSYISESNHSVSKSSRNKTQILQFETIKRLEKIEPTDIPEQNYDTSFRNEWNSLSVPPPMQKYPRKVTFIHLLPPKLSKGFSKISNYSFGAL